jgi:2-keto-4-pentenoate hydratase/2-oxohepta-3-ene-1,7-dioic acid hydratase in catechol pathway
VHFPERIHLMKLILFARPGDPNKEGRVGLVRLGRVLDVAAALNGRAPGNFQGDRAMISLIEAGASGLSLVDGAQRATSDSAWLELDQLRVLAPLRPTTLLCSGSNYAAHNREKAAAPGSGRELEFFVKTGDCVIGPEEPILHDADLTTKLDCETELAIVISKSARNIPTRCALDHVFGYTIVNDVTARDRQVRKTVHGDVWYDLARAKVFDTSAPLGPCIITADEIGNPQQLTIETHINGELRQRASTSEMIWSCAELISLFSRQITLRPGMVILTGTPAGTAWSMDPELGGKGLTDPALVPASRYCRAGDVIDCTIANIGTLRNRIAQATPAPAEADALASDVKTTTSRVRDVTKVPGSSVWIVLLETRHSHFWNRGELFDLQYLAGLHDANLRPKTLILNGEPDVFE